MLDQDITAANVISVTKAQVVKDAHTKPQPIRKRHWYHVTPNGPITARCIVNEVTSKNRKNAKNRLGRGKDRRPHPGKIAGSESKMTQSGIERFLIKIQVDELHARTCVADKRRRLGLFCFQ